MTRKTTIGLLLFVVSASVVGVQLADPFHSPGPDRFGSIDPSAPPEEVAAAALAQRGTTSHTARASYNETITNATMVTSRVEGTQTLRVDPDDHQALARTPNDDRVFWNQYYTWRHDPNESTTDRTARGFDLNNTGPYAVSGCDCVRVADDNETTLVLIVADPAAQEVFGIDPSEANRTGTLTLAIEKGDPPRLRRLEFRWVVTDEGDRFVGTRVITYSDWGETDVQRPDWAGYSALELLLDLIDYDP